MHILVFSSIRAILPTLFYVKMEALSGGPSPCYKVYTCSLGYTLSPYSWGWPVLSGSKYDLSTHVKFRFISRHHANIKFRVYFTSSEDK